jgi:hypothetical protein
MRRVWKCTVTTVKKSQAQTCEAWFRRKVLQHCPRPRSKYFGRYLATVRGETRRRSAAGRLDGSNANATKVAIRHDATGEWPRVARRSRSRGGSALALLASRLAIGPAGEAWDAAAIGGAQ